MGCHWLDGFKEPLPQVYSEIASSEVTLNGQWFECDSRAGLLKPLSSWGVKCQWLLPNTAHSRPSWGGFSHTPVVVHTFPGDSRHGGWEGTFSFRLFKGKKHQPSDSHPGVLDPSPPKEAVALQSSGNASSPRLLVVLLLASYRPPQGTLVFKEQGQQAKLYDHVCSHFLQIL